ncbi:MAG UNVERIFIED_CONTAM: hypothetical protein LVT10_03375 [Anaerolineae bacterium]
MGVVELKGIAKHFGDVRAVDGIDLKIEEGEFLVIFRTLRMWKDYFDAHDCWFGNSN